MAILVKTDDYHRWAVNQLRALSPPFLTCEAVLTELAHWLNLGLPDIPVAVQHSYR